MQSKQKNSSYSKDFKYAYNNIDNFMTTQNTNVPNILRFNIKNTEISPSDKSSSQTTNSESKKFGVRTLLNDVYPYQKNNTTNSNSNSKTEHITNMIDEQQKQFINDLDNFIKNENLTNEENLIEYNDKLNNKKKLLTENKTLEENQSTTKQKKVTIENTKIQNKIPEENQPTINQPTINQPTINQPTINQPTINQPTINQPTTNQPTTKQKKVIIENTKQLETKISSLNDLNQSVPEETIIIKPRKHQRLHSISTNSHSHGPGVYLQEKGDRQGDRQDDSHSRGPGVYIREKSDRQDNHLLGGPHKNLIVEIPEIKLSKSQVDENHGTDFAKFEATFKALPHDNTSTPTDKINTSSVGSANCIVTNESTIVEPISLEPINVDSTTIDSTTIDSTTIDSTTIDSTTIDSTTIDSTTIDSTTIDSTSVESVNIESISGNIIDINTKQVIDTNEKKIDEKKYYIIESIISDQYQNKNMNNSQNNEYNQAISNQAILNQAISIDSNTVLTSSINDSSQQNESSEIKVFLDNNLAQKEKEKEKEKEQEHKMEKLNIDQIIVTFRVIGDLTEGTKLKLVSNTHLAEDSGYSFSRTWTGQSRELVINFLEHLLVETRRNIAIILYNIRNDIEYDTNIDILEKAFEKMCVFLHKFDTMRNVYKKDTSSYARLGVIRDNFHTFKGTFFRDILPKKNNVNK